MRPSLCQRIDGPGIHGGEADEGLNGIVSNALWAVTGLDDVQPRLP